MPTKEGVPLAEYLERSADHRADSPTAFLISNGAAGSNYQKEKSAAIVRNSLQENGIGILDMQFSQSAGHFRELSQSAARSSASLVVVFGGDGSFNHALQERDPNSEKVYTSIPLGTIRLWGYETRTPDTVREASEALFSNGVVQQVDLGRVRVNELEQRDFLSMAGFGGDAQIVYDVEQMRKEKHQPAAIFLGNRAMHKAAQHAVAGVRELFDYRGHDIRVQPDDRDPYTVNRSRFLLAGNIKAYGLRGYSLRREAEYDDQLLELTAFEAGYTALVLPHLASAIIGRSPFPGAYYDQIQRAALEVIHRKGDNPLQIQVDGELFESERESFVPKHIQIAVNEKPVPILVPFVK
jgi:diacylglycerol kinase family enzyme